MKNTTLGTAIVVVALIALYPITYNTGVHDGERLYSGSPRAVWSLHQDWIYTVLWQFEGGGYAIIKTPAGAHIYVASTTKISDDLSVVVKLPERFSFYKGKIIAVGNDEHGKTIGIPVE